MNIMNRLKEGLWQEAMPTNFNVKKIIQDEGFTGVYSDINDRIQESKNVLASIFLGLESKEERQKALKVIKPVPLKNVMRFIDTLEKVVEENMEHLTFPKSKEGYQKMLLNVMKQNNLEDLSLFFVMSPEETLDLYQKHKEDLPKRNKNWLQSIYEHNLELQKKQIEKENIELAKMKELTTFTTPTVSSEKNNEQEESYPTSEKEAKQDVKPPQLDFFKKDKETTLAIEDLTKNLESLFSEIRKDNGEKAFENKVLASSNFERKINDSYLHFVNNVPNKNIKDWFLDVFIESQYNLLYKTNFNNENTYYANLYNDLISNYSGKLTNTGFSTEEVLNDKAFWGVLKVVRSKVDDQSYKDFTNNLIPKFLSLNSCDKTEKIKIGEDLIKFVKQDELNFKTRLNLWLGIGGNLLMTNDKGLSIVDIIKKEKNKMWDKVIVEIAKEKSINLNSSYPEHFEPEIKSVATKKDITINNRTSAPF